MFRLKSAGPILGLVVVNALWGLSFPLMRAVNLISNQRLGEWEDSANSFLHLQTTSFLIAIRFFVAGLLLRLVLPSLFVGLRWQHWVGGLGLGAVFATGLVLQTLGLNYIDASRSGFLTSMSMFFTPWVN